MGFFGPGIPKAIGL